MSIYYKSDILGKMSIIESYEYYDEPILFSCRSLTGQIYMSVWANQEEEISYWMYVAISNERFSELRKGHIEIQKIFSEPENNLVYIFICNREKDFCNLDYKKPSEIPLDWFPNPGDFLEINGSHSIEIQKYIDKNTQNIEIVNSLAIEATEPILEVQSIRNLSMISGRSTMNIHINPMERFSSEAPATLVWKFIEIFQESAYAIGQSKLGNLNAKGPYSSEIKRATELYLQPFNGSFGLRAIAREPENGENNSIIDDVFNEITDLLNCGSDSSKLNVKLKLLHERAVQKYTQLLEVISSYDSNLNLFWASSDGSKDGYAEINPYIANEAVKLIKKISDSRELTLLLVGKLDALNMNTRYFSLRDIKNNAKYTGYIVESCLDQARNANFNENFNLTVKQTVEIDRNTELEKYYYQLIGIEAVRGY